MVFFPLRDKTHSLVLFIHLGISWKNAFSLQCFGFQKVLNTYLLLVSILWPLHTRSTENCVYVLIHSLETDDCVYSALTRLKSSLLVRDSGLTYLLRVTEISIQILYPQMCICRLKRVTNRFCAVLWTQEYSNCCCAFPMFVQYSR